MNWNTIGHEFIKYFSAIRYLIFFSTDPTDPDFPKINKKVILLENFLQNPILYIYVIFLIYKLINFL